MTTSFDTTEFVERARAETLLAALVAGPQCAPQAGALVQDIISSPDPDGALLFLSRLIVDSVLSAPARELVASIIADDSARHALVTLCAASPYLARSLIQNPERRLPRITGAVEDKKSSE